MKNKDDGIKRCKKCNRVLKDLESIELGYGKICWRKIQNSNNQNVQEKLNLNFK